MAQKTPPKAAAEKPTRRTLAAKASPGRARSMDPIAENTSTLSPRQHTLLTVVCPLLQGVLLLLGAGGTTWWFKLVLSIDLSSALSTLPQWVSTGFAMGAHLAGVALLKVGSYERRWAQKEDSWTTSVVRRGLLGGISTFVILTFGSFIGLALGFSYLFLFGLTAYSVGGGLFAGLLVLMLMALIFVPMGGFVFYMLLCLIYRQMGSARVLCEKRTRRLQRVIIALFWITAGIAHYQSLPKNDAAWAADLQSIQKYLAGVKK